MDQRRCYRRHVAHEGGDLVEEQLAEDDREQQTDQQGAAAHDRGRDSP